MMFCLGGDGATGDGVGMICRWGREIRGVEGEFSGGSW